MLRGHLGELIYYYRANTRAFVFWPVTTCVVLYLALCFMLSTQLLALSQFTRHIRRDKTKEATEVLLPSCYSYRNKQSLGYLYIQPATRLTTYIARGL
jgi:hypothetical protein